MVQVVVVTGGGAGMGLAITRWHRARGWQVVAVERDPDAAAALGDDDGIHVVAGDVTAAGALEDAIGKARELGTLHAWVSNAAALGGRPLDELDDEHMDRMLRTNISAVVAGTRLAVAEFTATGIPGSVVAISSVHARLGFAGHTLYDATKGAVEAMCRSVAAEVGHRGIRCNAVAPGAVLTQREVEARRAGPLPHEPIPLAMFSTPEEIAEVVGFLTSPASAAVNGGVIRADRGLSAVFADEHWHSAAARG